MNPDVICLSNPDDNAAGQLQIDPRLGTTPATVAAAPPINGYSGQVPSYDTAVRFPRERRSVHKQEANDNILSLFAKYVNHNKHRIRKRQSCRCVPAGTCIKTSNGAGMIDFRIVSPVSST